MPKLKPKTKKRNPQDLTLRNLRAVKHHATKQDLAVLRRLDALEIELRRLKNALLPDLR